MPSLALGRTGAPKAKGSTRRTGDEGGGANGTGWVFPEFHRNKCIATRSKGLTSSNKKLLETRILRMIEPLQLLCSMPETSHAGPVEAGRAGPAKPAGFA